MALSREEKEEEQGAPCAVPYVKDWHLVSEFPDYEAYECPQYFSDDWLNWHFDRRALTRRAAASSGACPTSCASRDSSSQSGTAGQRDCSHEAPQAGAHHAGLSQGSEPSCSGQLRDVEGRGAGERDASLAQGSREPESPSKESSMGRSASTADYRFCYIGMKGSSTGLHADILRSYSWSINIAGKKRWKLLPPEATYLAMDPHGLQLAPSLELERVPDWEVAFPMLDQANAAALECVQGAGEAIFVPSGWHHTVDNLEDTASINHNWLNGHNVAWSWAFIRDTFLRAADLIADCRETCASVSEFVALVQRILRADIGLDLDEFACMVGGIAERELEAIQQFELGGCSVPESSLTELKTRNRDSKALPDCAQEEEPDVGLLPAFSRLCKADCVLRAMHDFAVETCHCEHAIDENHSKPSEGAVAWPWLLHVSSICDRCKEIRLRFAGDDSE